MIYNSMQVGWEPTTSVWLSSFLYDFTIWNR